jgi:RHS repeat-associated protein
VPIYDLPMQVMRTYDSFDKEKGDFGVGWNAEIANMRVQVNRPLGRSGWSFQGRNCRILLGAPLCEGTEFRDLSSHFVTIVWPDGREEVFDFRPTTSSAGVYFDANVKFEPRRGVTSTLEPLEGGQILQYWGDGNLYQDDGQTLYDPRRFKLTAKDGQVLTLSVERGLEKIEDPRGRSLTIDDSGVHSSTGKSIVFTRDGDGRISKITGPSGETYEYTYSAAGDLARVKDANGRTVSHEYDGDHNLREQKDPAGRPFQTLTYDDAGRLTAITDGAGNTTRIVTNVGERQEIVHDAAGRLTTLLTSSPRGDLISKKEIADGAARTTTYGHDADGNVTRTTDPLGHEISATYDERGNKLTETDELGRMTSFEYDGFAQLTRVVRPDGFTAIQATRNEWGDLTELNAGLGRATKFVYDQFGNQIKEIDAQGRVATMSYDESGNRIRAEMGESWSTMTYDASNRLKSVTDSRTARTDFVYDGDGRVLARSQALGFAVNYRYDFLGRLISETDPLGKTSEYTYDGAGRLTGRKDRNGLETTYEYDANGRLVRANLPDGRANTVVYDSFGRAKEMTNRDAKLMFERDAMDRLTSLTTTGVAGSDQPTTAIQYEYDAAGQPVSMTGPGGTIRYAYDRLGELESLTDTDGGRFSWERDLAGRAVRLSRPNGVTTTASWDLLDQRTRVTQLAADGTALDDVQYRYESPVGLMSQMINGRGATNFHYDTRGYLSTADYPVTAPSEFQPDEFYNYDLNGNQMQGSRRYDTAGRLYENPDYYGYDGEGNQIWRAPMSAPYPRTSFSWDAEGQLRKVVNPDGTTKASYRYDPLGRRIEVSGPEGTKRFAYGIDDNALAEYDGHNNLAATNTFEHGLDRPLARHAAGRDYYQLQDGLDNVSALTDESGQVLERYRYGAYGQPVGSLASTRNPFTFAGREWDPGSSTYYFRARYYDPVNGRFLSEDPEISGNPYAYAGNNPLQNRDPTGRVYGYAETVSEMQIREELAAIEQHQVTGQVHHAISRSVWNALERNPKLAGNYKYRDSRWTTRAKDKDAHRGYQGWHRRLDDEIADKIDENPWWEPKDFEAYLRGRYQVLDLLARFPLGLPA